MISDKELCMIKGGSKIIVGGIIGSFLTFVIGVIDGQIKLK